jgi:hypothetical protein
VLVSCPLGHQLVNSSLGNSNGPFSQENQYCKPCLRGQYIIDPNNDVCQECPNGKCSTPAIQLPLSTLSLPS